MKKLFPVIHHLDIETTKNNLEIIINNGCHGVFLINMDCNELELNESLGLAKQMGGKDFYDFDNNKVKLMMDKINNYDE